MKGAWMLVVSLRGAIFGLTYGVLGKTVLYLAVQVLFRVAFEKYINIRVLSEFSVT